MSFLSMFYRSVASVTPSEDLFHLHLHFLEMLTTSVPLRGVGLLAVTMHLNGFRAETLGSFHFG